MICVGFTGTSKGLSYPQRTTLCGYLSALAIGEFHHGDCVGADSEAHDIVVGLGVDPHIHPPSNPRKRAYRRTKREVVVPKEYLLRNRDIVDVTELLIACPAEATEKLRSGTWATVRYACSLGRRVVLILPSGRLEDWWTGVDMLNYPIE